MVAQTAADPSQTLLSRWRRDYRLSLTLLVAGVIIIAVLVAFIDWADFTGNYPSSGVEGLSLDLIGTVGGGLLLFGGIFAYHNWALLRQSERIA